MISPELRVTIVERNRLSAVLRQADREMARAMSRRDEHTWRHWHRVRSEAFDAVRVLDRQVTALDQYRPLATLPSPPLLG